jgi:hypothetical protein
MFTALFWKKSWIWLKHYWYWPVIIILLIFSMVSDRGLKEKLFGLLKKSKENHDKEIQIIKETAEETDKKKTEIFTEHLEELEKIEKEHEIQVKDLKEEKQKELLATIENNKNSPDKLAEEVAKILSAEFLKNNR